jgi:hypothetical protein
MLRDGNPGPLGGGPGRSASHADALAQASLLPPRLPTMTKIAAPTVEPQVIPCFPNSPPTSPPTSRPTGKAAMNPPTEPPKRAAAHRFGSRSAIGPEFYTHSLRKRSENLFPNFPVDGIPRLCNPHMDKSSLRGRPEFHAEWLRDEPCDATATEPGSYIPADRCQLSPGNGEHEIRQTSCFLPIASFPFPGKRGHFFGRFFRLVPSYSLGFQESE